MARPAFSRLLRCAVLASLPLCSRSAALGAPRGEDAGARTEGDAPLPERDLARWLLGLSLRLPGASSSREVWPFGNVTLETRGLRCSGFAVDGVEVRELEHAAAARSVALLVRNAGAERCEGGWRVLQESRTLREGGFSFKVVGLTLHLPVLFDASARDRPVSVPAAGCQTSVSMEGFQFDGEEGILAEAFAMFLQDALNFAVDRFGCHLPNEALEGANALITSWLRPPRPPRPLPAELPARARAARLVDWASDVRLLQAVPNASEGAAAVRSLVARMTAGTDRLAGSASTRGLPGMSLPRRWSEKLGLQVTADLTNFSIAGLGTVAECEALAPATAEPHSLRSGCAFRRLNVSGSLAIELRPLGNNASAVCHAASPFTFDLTAALALREVRTVLQVLVAADRGRLDRLTVDGLLDKPLLQALGTLAAATYALNVTELDARAGSVDELELAQDGGPLGAMLASSVTALASAFLQAAEFQHVLPNALAAAAFPRLRDALNRRSARLVARLSPYADPDGGAARPDGAAGYSSSHIAWMTVCASCGFFPLVLLTYFAAHLHYKRRAPGTEEPPCSQASSASPLEPDCAGTGEDSVPVSLASSCSLRMRRGVPILIVLNMAVGFWAVLVPVVDVRVRAVGGLLDPGKPVADESLLVYSFPELVHDFAKSRAYICVVLIVLGCLVVPQGVALLMAAAFVKPMRPALRRYLCLMFLVVFRLVAICQCFLCYVVLTLRARVEVPGMTVEVVGEPAHGVAAGTLATIFGLVLSGILYYLHSEAASPQPGPDEADNASAEDGEAAARVSHRTACLALLGAAAASACLGGAFTAQLLSLELTGLVGDVESLHISATPPTKDMWLVALPRQLYASTDIKPVALMSGGLMVVISMIGPVVCCVAWLVQWTWVALTGKEPRCSRSRLVRRCAAASPYLYGWCATDVVWASAFAACAEMDLPVQFIVMKKAGPLCSLLQHDADLPCVHIVGELHAGSWFLLASVVLCFAMFVCTSWAFTPRPRNPVAARGENLS